MLLLQALLFQRPYIIGHEASHRKLLPGDALRNDLLGQLMMLPILIPVRIYRQVHMFHHGFNRRDHHTSALDVFVSPAFKRWSDRDRAVMLEKAPSAVASRSTTAAQRCSVVWKRSGMRALGMAVRTAGHSESCGAMPRAGFAEP